MCFKVKAILLTHIAQCKSEKVRPAIPNLSRHDCNAAPKWTGSVRFVKKQDQVFPDLSGTTRILASLVQHHNAT